jgi:hypothetical protein
VLQRTEKLQGAYSVSLSYHTVSQGP